MRRRDEEKERRILASTLALVAQQGLAGLSMEAVARTAGVAIGTVYIYFESKEALLNALYLETKRAFSREVFGHASATEPVRPAFERVCIAYMKYVAAHRAEVLLMQQFRNSPFVLEGTLAASEDATAPLLALLERGKAEGLLKDVPTPLMIAFLQATLAELTAYVGSEPSRHHRERYAQIARLAWDALKA
ncbi:TetR/AcrR family transcriptional regulator [Sandaracinus amylolyticus]|uniref:TetR/AcrR family transcriptional regulator n=1 Tax=Sandaracinus amylolyticus TaxID=927083 RepID=UPI001F2CD797|nr:TetR/AcrR family transcriptional regulator [Sandaracinus amylolyticus]UJR81585.1 HTH tetR-type domain-containing protein [Sandaracinus amylolyticus]